MTLIGHSPFKKLNIDLKTSWISFFIILFMVVMQGQKSFGFAWGGETVKTFKDKKSFQTLIKLNTKI